MLLIVGATWQGGWKSSSTLMTVTSRANGHVSLIVIRNSAVVLSIYCRSCKYKSCTLICANYKFFQFHQEIDQHRDNGTHSLQCRDRNGEVQTRADNLQYEFEAKKG